MFVSRFQSSSNSITHHGLPASIWRCNASCSGVVIFCC